MKTDFTTTLSNTEIQMVVRALIGRPRKDDEEAMKALARTLTEQRAAEFERQAQLLRDMLRAADE